MMQVTGFRANRCIAGISRTLSPSKECRSGFQELYVPLWESVLASPICAATSRLSLWKEALRCPYGRRLNVDIVFMGLARNPSPVIGRTWNVM